MPHLLPLAFVSETGGTMKLSLSRPIFPDESHAPRIGMTAMGSVMIVVKSIWDAEARVWVAESAELPGLIVEASSQEEMLDKLADLIPELIVESGFDAHGLPEVPYYVMSEAIGKARLAG